MIKRLGKWKSSSLVKSASISTLNQIVTSGSNFILGLFLISYISVEEFGTYGILHALSLMIAGFGNAVFLGQMVVNFPDKKCDEKHAYASTIFQLVTLVIMTLFFIAVTSFVLLNNFFVNRFEYWSELFAVILFSSGYLTKEFFCRLSYTYREEIKAVCINSLISVTMVILMSIFVLFGIQLTALKVIQCYAFSVCVGTMFGLFEAKLHIRPEYSQLKAELGEVWSRGKWALVSDLLYAGRQQAHIFVTAAVLGPTGVGMINAAKLFLTPIMLITPSISQIYIVRLVALRNSEPLKLLYRGALFSLFSSVCVVIYGVILVFLYRYLHNLVISEEYLGLHEIVFAWFFVALCSAIRYGLETTQKAMKRFKSLAVINFPITLLALSVVYLLISHLGTVGAVYGVAIAELVLAIVLAILVLKAANEVKSSKINRKRDIDSV